MTSLALLMLVAASPQTAADAEQAFDAAIMSDGQWTTYRSKASKDAILFTPLNVTASNWLQDRVDPKMPFQRQLTDSYTSCDGTLAVNTGARTGPGRARGYFTTIWRPDRNGWRWILDHGDAIKKKRKVPKVPALHKASCESRPGQSFNIAAPTEGGGSGSGQSYDGTLRYDWRVEPDGARTFSVRLWNGKGFDEVLKDVVKAPK